MRFTALVSSGSRVLARIRLILAIASFLHSSNVLLIFHLAVNVLHVDLMGQPQTGIATIPQILPFLPRLRTHPIRYGVHWVPRLKSRLPVLPYPTPPEPRPTRQPEHRRSWPRPSGP